MNQIAEFRLFFIGIIIETVPFITIGVFLTFLFELFVPLEYVRKMFTGKKLMGIIIAALLGFVVPLCECGIVPIVSRFAKRGVPLPVLMTFLIAVPSLSPIVVASTSAAFVMAPNVVVLRFATSFVLALAAGFVFLVLDRNGKLSSLAFPEPDSGVACGCGGCDDSDSFADKCRHGFEHAVSDFTRTLGFIVMAAVITAAVKVFASDQMVGVIAAHPAWSTPAMMLFAFVTSTCSDADAFIAAAMTKFTDVSKLAFMLLGPVIDIKLVILHFALFPRKVALTLLVVYPLLVTLGVMVLHFIAG